MKLGKAIIQIAIMCAGLYVAGVFIGYGLKASDCCGVTVQVAYAESANKGE